MPHVNFVFPFEGRDFLYYVIERDESGVPWIGTPHSDKVQVTDEILDDIYKGQQEHINLRYLLDNDPNFLLWWGERSNGKTFAGIQHCIFLNMWDGTEGGIIRRQVEDIKMTYYEELMRNITYDENGINHIYYMTGGRWNSGYYYRQRFYYCNEDEDGNITERCGTPFCYSLALSAMRHGKSVPYPRVDWIMFDEFITEDGYLERETKLFKNVLSTIIRRRTGVTILLCGNHVDTHCPYFREFGIDSRRMKQGEAKTFKIPLADKSGRFTIVNALWTDTILTQKPSDVYFNFGNTSTGMITRGEYDLEVYPHLPDDEEYKPKDVMYNIFVEYDGELIQGDVVCHDNKDYLFFHQKTTPIKYPDTDIVYSDHYDPRVNWFCALLDTSKAYTRRIAGYFRSGRVFYADNMIGDSIQSFIKNIG